MKLALQLFGLGFDEYRPLTERAEAAGFDRVWLADHVITPLEYEKNYPYNAAGDPGYRAETPLADVAVMLGHLSAVTRRIELATGVFVLPLRNPFHVARAFATLQNLSRGRLVLGLGVGWMAEEYDAVGEPFARRGARMDEMLDVLDLLWSGEAVEHQGEWYRFPPVQFGGAPTKPIPLVFGGHSDAALRRAAMRGDGWYGPNCSLEESIAYRERIERLRTEAGRADHPFTHHVRLVGDLTAANVTRYAEAGFTSLVFGPFNHLPHDASPADRLDAIDRLGAELSEAPR